MDTTFLLGSSLVAVLIVQVLKDLFGKLQGRFGAIWTQVILLAVSFGVAGIGVLIHGLPPEIINITGIIFASSIAIYEILYKAIYQQAIKGN